MIEFNTFNRSAFNNILYAAHKSGVSDVIVRSGRPIMFKRFNKLTRLDDRNIMRSELFSVLQEIYQNSITANLGRGRDAKFRYSIMLEDDSKIFCRCHITALGSNDDDYGVELITRILNEEIPTIEQIDLPLCIVDRLQREVGTMLVSGPTGSGKSTAVASGLQHHVQNHFDNIITFEDPIEFNLEGILNQCGDIAQSETPKNIDSFERAFSGSLRRAPDIIFWSEIRDSKAISNLTTSALTGHYVVSTVHTNSTELTLPRLIDAYPTEEQRSAAVRIYQAIDTIMHQRLLLNLDGNGRTAVRSWCFFDSDAQENLFDTINHPEKLQTIVRNIMKENGRFLIDDVKEKFSMGKIGLESYVKCVQKFGHKSDLNAIRAVGDELVEKNLLTTINFNDNWKNYGP